MLSLIKTADLAPFQGSSYHSTKLTLLIQYSEDMAHRLKNNKDDIFTQDWMRLRGSSSSENQTTGSGCRPLHL